MGHKWWRRALVVSMAAFALVLGGCGSEDKVGTVDFGRIAQESAQAKQIAQDIQAKQVEIIARLSEAEQNQSAEEFAVTEQKARREMQIFQMGKKQQFEALVESQAALLAKDKKLSIIMHKDAVHYQGTDVTEDLIARLKAAADQSAAAQKESAADKQEAPAKPAEQQAKNG